MQCIFFGLVVFATLNHGAKATIVYPRMLESRAEDGRKLLKINDDITLKLSKSSVLPEDFLIYSTKDDAPIAYHMRGADVEKNIYEDAEQMATVDVSEEDGISVEGVLGNNLRIRPLEGIERSINGQQAHELYEIENPDNAGHRDDDYATPPVNETSPMVESRRLQWYKAPRIPVMIYPEVHVVVDLYICQALQFVESKIARYVALMMASANLRYKSVIQPRVQLRLVGVSVTKKRVLYTFSSSTRRNNPKTTALCIAFSLGCAHDGNDAKSWPYGHIGSKDCSWDDGFMMSYKFVVPNMYRFSKCCQREMMNLYNRPEYSCLIVKNSVSVSITTSKLPGEVSSRQKYCEKVYHEYSYVKVDRKYDISKCYVKCFINRNGENMLQYAVDGVKCGKRKICVLGNCTSKADLKRAE
ncbi:metalloproteinase [Rhipicephalus sanguineus]|uniref:metalloproteinase n=1 Tax=Rhipicephalus sanguineus TaxID=34632 RepID=UPI0020C2487E|nr:metalloproteinase [Rhipicephalus sanguineus]